MSNLYTKIINTQEDRSLPDLSSIPTPLTDDDNMGFGKYKDTKLKDVPIKHLAWMVQETTDYPRVQRSPRWTLVIEWIKSKK
mgnify:FL=1